MDCFDGRVICADDGQMGVGRGKPCPDIFLIAARELLQRPVGIDEHDATDEEKAERAKGLVFEDAIPGVHAGKRAGMKVVWVPDSNLLDVDYNGPRALSADEVTPSVASFVPQLWGLPPFSD